MRVVPPVSGCLRTALLFANLLLWASAIAHIAVACWFRFDPAQNFQLQLVHFSEQPPLLAFAVHLLLGTGLFLLLVGAVGCVSANKLERFLLSSFILLLLLALLAKLGVALLALLYQTNFPQPESMRIHLANISQNRYYRDRWVLPVMDSVQFYHKCCGGYNASDYFGSFWYLTNTERGTRSFVPWSCCRQSQQGRAWALHPIDPLCIQYAYASRSFNDSVNIDGCGPPMHAHMAWQVHILWLTCALGSFVDVFALGLAIKCLSEVWIFYSAISAEFGIG